MFIVGEELIYSGENITVITSVITPGGLSPS
jgi:hypothetical protein